MGLVPVVPLIMLAPNGRMRKSHTGVRIVTFEQSYVILCIQGEC
jgi:hypothetical protein